MGEDLPRDVALEAAHDLRLRLSFCGATSDIVDSRLVAAHQSNDDPVEGGIGLAIASAVQPVRLVLPLEAGSGQAPHILAKAASERMRSGLSPTRISISAA